VLPVPDRNVSIDGSRIICSGSSVRLFAEGGTGRTYQWTRDGKIIAGETSDWIRATQPGIYTVFITTPTLCAIESDPVEVMVVDKFNVGPVTGPTASNPGAITRHTVANPVAGAFYAWQVTGGLIVSGQTSPSIEVLWTTTTSGNQSISVHATQQCSDTTRVTVAIDATVGVETTQSPTTFTMHPNPTDGDVTLSIPARARTQELTVRVYSVIGAKVLESRVQPGATMHTIPLGHLPVGVYRVAVSSATEMLLESSVVRK
jgi:hypothetical protein